MMYPIEDLTLRDDSMTMSYPGRIVDANVRVRLNHTYDEDLNLWLVGPDGTQVLLSYGNGGEGDNYGAGATDCSGTFTTFDAQAITPITGAPAPFAGVFRPEGDLSAFNGKSGDGTWKLRIQDDAEGDTGMLFCWGLDLVLEVPDQGADLSVVLQDSPDPVRPAGTVRYLLVAFNQGPLEAPNAVATFNLPSEATLVSATNENRSVPPCSRNATVVTCPLGTLPRASGPNRIEIVVTAPMIERSTVGLVASASVRSDVLDHQPANNSTTQATTVLNCTPRPPVSVRVEPSGSGRLKVTVSTPTSLGAPPIRIGELWFPDPPANARVEIDGVVRTLPYMHQISAGTPEATFYVTRGAGAGPFMLPFVVTDDCGQWRTFAGAGQAVP